jgi:hypothetical protein
LRKLQSAVLVPAGMSASMAIDGFSAPNDSALVQLLLPPHRLWPCHKTIRQLLGTIRLVLMMESRQGQVTQGKVRRGKTGSDARLEFPGLGQSSTRGMSCPVLYYPVPYSTSLHPIVMPLPSPCPCHSGRHSKKSSLVSRATGEFRFWIATRTLQPSVPLCESD